MASYRPPEYRAGKLRWNKGGWVKTAEWNALPPPVLQECWVLVAEDGSMIEEWRDVPTVDE
jgi:hypothetical protein